MTEIKAHSSLLALVESHLSKISLQESQSSDVVECSALGTFAGKSNDILTQSKLFTPDRILPLPKLGLSESPISSILANQVANMLIAKEKRQEEERKKSLMEDDTGEDDNYEIDLTQALLTPATICTKIRTDTPISNSSSCESLFKLKFIDSEEDEKKTTTPEPLLPCCTDMSYLLLEKRYNAKCSNFGKVLTSRLRPVLPMHWPEKVEHKIKRFDFKTPSPCDLYKERLRRPTVSCNYIPSIFDEFD